MLRAKQYRTDELLEPASDIQRVVTFNIHKLIDKLPPRKSGWVLQNIEYCGPFTPLKALLNEDGHPLLDQKP